MATVNLNTEIYEALSIISQDESLLKKAAKALKRLAAKRIDETEMTKEEFFSVVEQSLEDANQGRVKRVNTESELTNFLNSL